MITRRCFTVRAVRQDLMLHLAQHLAQAVLAPCTRRFQLRQHQPKPQQANHVGKIMIARRDVCEFEIAPDVRAVRVEHREQFGKPFRVHLRRIFEKLKGREQVHRAQCDFHRASPVRAAPDHVLCLPACELREKFRAQILVARHGVGASQGDEMSEAIEFPQHARIRAVAPREADIAVIIKRPLRA